MTVLLDGIGQDLPVLGLVFIILLFVAFGTERFPPVTVAVVGAGMTIAFGWLTPDLTIAAFVNSVPITIATCFVLSGALVHTGAIDSDRVQIMPYAIAAN